MVYQSVVGFPMARMAECDEVLLGVAAHTAASHKVVNFELSAPATMLTAPPITFEHLPVELLVGIGIKPNSLLFAEGGQGVPPETCAGGTAT